MKTVNSLIAIFFGLVIAAAPAMAQNASSATGAKPAQAAKADGKQDAKKAKAHKHKPGEKHSDDEKGRAK